MIKIENKTLKRDQFEIKDMSFEIERNKITAIVGRNAAGKSSLIYGLIGSLNLNIESSNVKSSYVGQDIPFNPKLYVYQIPEILELIDHDLDKNLFKSYLNKFNISSSTKIELLSKGQNKYVMLALALARNPNILYLDEISLNIDQYKKENFKELLETYMQEDNRTVVLSTNQIDVFEDVIDNIIYIKNGHIFYSGSLLNLKTNVEIVAYNQALDDIIYSEENVYDPKALVQRKNKGEGSLTEILKFLERSSYEKIHL